MKVLNSFDVESTNIPIGKPSPAGGGYRTSPGASGDLVAGKKSLKFDRVFTFIYYQVASASD